MASKRGRTFWWLRLLAVAIAFVVVIAGVLRWAGVSLPFMGKESKPGVYQVDAKGGSYKLPSGGQVTVPKGAVNKPTTLTVTPRRELQSGDTAPLQGVRQGGFAFDVSLSRGVERNIQPAENKPLVLTLPIKAPAPEGKARMLVLAYTAIPGNAYALLPSQMAGADKLTVQLPHLSPKFVTYVTDQQLLDSFDPEPVKRSRGKNCPDKLTVDGITVRLKGEGWSADKEDSAIFACLAPSKENAGYVRVNVANMIGYILAAKGSNARLASSRGGLEEELDKYVARHIPGSGDVEAYLGRGGKIVGSIDANSLYESAAKIELWADANTFWAESSIKVVGLIVGLITGQSDPGKTLRVVNAVLHVKDVIGCVEDAAESAVDDKSALKFGKALLGCFNVIAEAIGEYVDPLKLLGKFGWALDAAKTIIEQTISMINGGKLQLAGRLTATVTADAPACPRQPELHNILKKAVSDSRVDTWNEEVQCQGSWAHGGADAGVHDPQTDSRTGFVLHLSGGEWRVVAEGSDMGGSPLCKKGDTPDFVRNWMSCYKQ